MPGNSMPGNSLDGKPLQWTLPAGWTQAAGNQMRVATLKPAADSQAEVSVVKLGGNAGGELPNVNRWRGQLGLAPTDEAALPGMRREIGSRAGKLAVYDFSADGPNAARAVIGMLAAADGTTWFLKLSGPAAAVGAAQPAFSQLLETLRFD